MSGSDGDLQMIVGEIRGKLDSLIDTIDRERQERDAEERIADLDREAIRAALDRLSRAIEPLTVRMAALDSLDVKTSLINRVREAETVLDDFKRKQAAAVLILGGGLSIIMFGIQTYAADIKALVLRIMRIG